MFINVDLEISAKNVSKFDRFGANSEILTVFTLKIKLNVINEFTKVRRSYASFRLAHH